MEILLLALLTLVASCIGTITGFGLSTIMIPVLLIFLPPLEVIFLVSIVHWFGDLWKVILFHKGVSMRLILLFSCVGLVMSYWGASLSLDIPLSPLLRLLGGFLVAYAVFLFLLPKFKVTASTPTALFGGALSGFCAGVFGIGGPLRALFLNAFNLPKVVYIATAGAIGIIVDSTRIITYALEGVSLPDRLWWSLVILIPASFVGAELAKHLVEKIPQHAFRLIIVTFLGLIGVKLLFFPG